MSSAQSINSLSCSSLSLTLTLTLSVYVVLIFPTYSMCKCDQTGDVGALRKLHAFYREPYQSRIRMIVL